MKKILIVVVLLLSAYYAQAQFNVSAQLRTRAEMDRGIVKPVHDTMSTFYYVTQRTRLSFDYNQPKYQMRFSLQDVRVWGDGNVYSSTGLFAATNSFNVHEAWFKIRFGQYSNLTIGRQELKYDDQRLISWRNWNQYGLSYDAAVFNYLKNDFEINAGASYNNQMLQQSGKPVFENDLYDANNLMKTLSFLRIKGKLSEAVSASAIVTAAGYQKSTDARILYLMPTAGFWMGIKSGRFDATINAYYQTGHAQSGKEVSAFMLTANPGVSIGKFRLGAGIDYVSGHDASNDDYLTKEKTFNQMYGAVFSYYGWMNQYSYMKSSTANGGLIDVYPNIEMNFNKQHTARVYFHFFNLANDVMIENLLIDDRNLGQELDLMYIYKYNSDLMLQAGFSYYFVTDTFERVKKYDLGHTQSPLWGWVMLTFKPTLFTTKNN
ncbi:MAG: alginate export family protein [Bacteroidales bacterium]